MSDQPDASEQPGYSAPAKWLHWLIAPIVLAMIPVGAIMGDLPQWRVAGLAVLPARVPSA